MRQDARARPSQVIYDRFRRSDVAAHAPKRFGESAHQNVDVRRVDPTMLAAALARVAESADAMRLI